jgi:hypothetical protein
MFGPGRVVGAINIKIKDTQDASAVQTYPYESLSEHVAKEGELRLALSASAKPPLGERLAFQTEQAEEIAALVSQCKNQQSSGTRGP